MNTAKPILPLCLSLFMMLSGVSTAAYSANRISKEDLPWYEIEVIIFANSAQKGLATETWPESAQFDEAQDIIGLSFEQDQTNQLPSITQTAFPDATTANKLTANGTLSPDGKKINLPVPFVFIPPEEFKLAGLDNKLTKSNTYETLLHIAWRQPTELPKKAIPVYVFDGMDIPTVNSNSDNAVSANTLSMNNSASAFNSDNSVMGPNVQRLYGTIKLSVSRYLHVDTDLHYRSPVIQQEYVLAQSNSSFFNSSAELVETLVERNVLLDFQLAESRRLRSKEIHYYDHPMFGMIVLVTPFDVIED